MALSISSGNGSITSQANTSTPQASVGPATKAATAGSVQHGTASSLLTSSGGIGLTNQALPSVTLGNTSTSTVQKSQPAAAPVKHHLNPVLLGLAVGIFVIALASAWIITRSAKNTTY